MLTFLEQVFQSPPFIQHLPQIESLKKKKTGLGSPRTRRRFVKPRQQELGSAFTFVEGQTVSYRPGMAGIILPEMQRLSSPVYRLQYVLGELEFCAESMPFQIGVVPSEELTKAELTRTTGQVGTGSSGFRAGLLSSGPRKPLFKVKDKVPSQSAAEHFASFPGELMEENFPEFPCPGIQNLIQQKVMCQMWELGALEGYQTFGIWFSYNRRKFRN
ncbi:Heat Stress Transcription Factor [Ancistrocladus abbreviatus]